MDLGKYRKLSLRAKISAVVNANNVRRSGNDTVTRTVISTPSPRTCQWLEGEAVERNFCGKPVLNGHSWCKGHKHRVFIPVKVIGKAS